MKTPSKLGIGRVGTMLSLLAVLSVLVGSSATATSQGEIVVGPQTFTDVPIINDCVATGNCDMVGPEIGALKYRQTGDGSLDLNLHFLNVDPNVAYPVYLTCGPSHDQACNYIQIGTITTDGLGRGKGVMTVPVATLQQDPFGCGYRADHVDLVAGSNYPVAGAVNFYVPCAAGMQPHAPTGSGDPTTRG